MARLRLSSRRQRYAEGVSRVREHYDRDPERERERLDIHRTEFAVTLRALSEHLPPPPARLADVGGGPGRYAVELAKRGYSVTLIDLSPELVRLAGQQAEREHVDLDARQGDARRLEGLADASFDGLLLLGPLYHLLGGDERRRALQEAHRVLRSGAPIFAAWICRYAPLRWAAKHDPDLLVREADDVRAILESGLLVPGPERFFTDAYVALPDEIEPFMAACGFEHRALIGVEGIVSFIEDAVNETQGETWDAWVDVNYRLGQQRSLLGASEHLLYVGCKA